MNEQFFDRDETILSSFARFFFIFSQKAQRVLLCDFITHKMAFTTENGRPLFNVCCLRNTATIVNDTLLEQLTRDSTFYSRDG